MGFGKKTDFETGRTLDLDKTYRTIIKPAVKNAGLECVRADEIVHSGMIDVPMYEQLLNADVVVADLSTSNKNAFYELGVRHALKPYTTIVICEDGLKAFPFDINHVAVRQYHHMGDGIDFDEVERFRKVLTDAIVEIRKKEPQPDDDSPVYTFLNGLNPPALAKAIQGVAVAVANSAPDAGVELTGEVKASNPETHSELMEQVDKAQKAGDFTTAKILLNTVHEIRVAANPDRPADPYIIQRLAFVTYKSGQPTRRQALEDARGLLETLNPMTSNDTETLGLWGAVNKGLWDETKDVKHLDEAVRSYERGFFLRNDYYNGINFAYILNVRAANTANRTEAIADFVQAERARREVISICKSKLSGETPLNDEDKYWVLASMAEAYLGIGDEVEAQQKLDEASAAGPAQEMIDTTREQMDNLRPLLADSPLKYVKAQDE
jgi:hypothetical protein